LARRSEEIKINKKKRKTKDEIEKEENK